MRTKNITISETVKLVNLIKHNFCFSNNLSNKDLRSLIDSKRSDPEIEHVASLTLLVRKLEKTL